MKRYIRYVLLMVLFLLPINVFAATELTQEEFTKALAGTSTVLTVNEQQLQYKFINPGEYVLSENIVIEDDHSRSLTIDKDVVLDLNGKTITTQGEINIKRCKVTIKGNGSILANDNSIDLSENADLTIENGTYHGRIEVTRESKLLIKGGSFAGDLHGQEALKVDDTCIVTIEDGTFTGGEIGYSLDTGISVVSTNIYPKGSITINGGTFRGLCGMCIPIEASSIVHLAGGTFTGKETSGAIRVIDHNDGFDFNTLLKDGYEYDQELIIDDSNNEVIFTQLSLSVRQKAVEPVEDAIEETPTEEKKVETKNPKTGDFIHIYVLTLIISALGLLVLRKRMN